jgi:predicted DNA-binding ribbon-helix-helix protein
MLVNSAVAMPPAPCLLSLSCLRHVRIPHHSTIRLERQFWAQIDSLAKKKGRTWHELVIRELANKPDGQGAASWLRVRCLLLTKKEAKHG